MTGEITLRGKVLPVGGIREKLLAARRAGITDIIICSENKRNVDEIKPEYLNGLTFHYVDDIKQGCGLRVALNNQRFRGVELRRCLGIAEFVMLVALAGGCFEFQCI